MIEIIQGHQVKVIRQTWSKVTQTLQTEQPIILPVPQQQPPVIEMTYLLRIS